MKKDRHQNHVDLFCGKEVTPTTILNREPGQIGEVFIIPVNLANIATFLEQNGGTITISRIEKRTYTSQKRNIVYTSTSQIMFYWDKSTGLLVEETSAYPDFILITKSEKMWQT